MNSQSKFIVDKMRSGYKVQDVKIKFEKFHFLLTNDMYQQFFKLVILKTLYIIIISMNPYLKREMYYQLAFAIALISAWKCDVEYSCPANLHFLLTANYAMVFTIAKRTSMIAKQNKLFSIMGRHNHLILI